MLRVINVNMAESPTTCWTLIRAAAVGGAREREEYVNRYGAAVRAYLAARWQNSPLSAEIDDASQDFFIECFKQGGPLAQAEQGLPGGFRAFVFGIARNVALRYEQRIAKQSTRQASNGVSFSDVQADETSLSQIFDRAWANQILREAGERQIENAERSGAAAIKRVELLQLRFQEGMAIREIAKAWQTNAASLHHEYAKAREEYKQALKEVVAFNHPDASPRDVQRECEELLTMLS